MKGLLLGGVAARIFDISYVFTKWGLRGVSPERILHSIASGFLRLSAVGRSRLALCMADSFIYS